MNHIIIDELAGLYEILDCSIFISGEVDQVEEEIAYNGWEIMLNDELAKRIKSEDLIPFISDLIKMRSEEIFLMKPLRNAILYFWFDDFPVRLCFNILSDADRVLPFNCKTNFIDSPFPILNEFVIKAHDYAIRGNLHEIQFFEKGDPAFDENYEVDFSKMTMDVWKIVLPLSKELNL